MSSGLLFLGQAASKAKRDELDNQRHAHERRDRALHGLGRLGTLNDDDRLMLADIQRQLADDRLSLSTRRCPQCRQPFANVRMRNLSVEYCRQCRGSWFDPGELGLITHNPRDVPSSGVSHRKSRFRCPVCDTAMWECIFRKPFNLLVDRCPDGHGVYLEEGELERALRMSP
jgi:Zn-finger nucleic acid-binding protein